MIAHDIFRVLVVEHKMISYEYFMDEIKPWEIDNLLSVLPYSERDKWEQTRMLMYIIAQVNSTKRIKAEDLMKFAWDKEQHEQNITNNEIKRLREKAKNIITKI